MARRINKRLSLVDKQHLAVMKGDVLSAARLQHQINQQYSVTQQDYTYNPLEPIPKQTPAWGPKHAAAYRQSVEDAAKTGGTVLVKTGTQWSAGDSQGQGRGFHPVYKEQKAFFKRDVREPAVLGSTEIGYHFRQITPEQLQAQRRHYTAPITVLDVETAGSSDKGFRTGGPNDEILSVSALKGVIDKKTGEFVVLDSLEHYYMPSTQGGKFFQAMEVTGLDAKRLSQLRIQQGANYPSQYSGAGEKEALLEFLKGTTVVGHAVQTADFNWLGIAEEMQDYKTIDTWVAAQNMGVKKGKQGLEDMYKRLLGRTVKQAGYRHHFSFHDVMMNAELIAAMYRMQNNEGRDIRYVINHSGKSYVAHSDLAGTSIARGGYRVAQDGRKGERYYMNEDKLTEDDSLSREFGENGDRIPEGMHEEKEGWGDDEDVVTSLVSLFKSIKSPIEGLQGIIQQANDTLSAYTSTKKLQIESRAASMDEIRATAYIKSFGYTQPVQEDMITRANLQRAGRESKLYETVRWKIWEAKDQGLLLPDQAAALESEFGEEGITPKAIYAHMRKEIRETQAMRKTNEQAREWDIMSTLGDVRDDDSPFDKNTQLRKIAYLNRMRKKGYLSENDVDELELSQAAMTGSYEDLVDATDAVVEANQRSQQAQEWGIMSLLGDVRDDDNPFDRDTQLRKLAYLKRMRKEGYISKKDADKLEQSHEALTGSYEDLVDATDDVIEANQRLLKIYAAIGQIKPYDINQYVSSLKARVGGVLGDAKGLIPNFLLNPIGRLTNASFNAIDQRLAPWNAVQRTWNSGIGSALTGILGASMGPMGFGLGTAIHGGVNAITQIAGNYKQAQMETSLLGLQNTINTIGAGVSWLLTPFQLLGKALKVATNGLTGLGFSLSKLLTGTNRFMQMNIGTLGQMGNPLQPLTGVDYLSYQRTGLADVASLLHTGSVNADIESFATMQRNLYRFGQADTGKILAANMLGVFSEAFTPTTDAKGSYYSMANKILGNLYSQDASQQADTLYYAQQLSSTLAQTLRTALMQNVTDIRQLESNEGMYWRPINDEEEPHFRKVYKEYNIASQQFGFSKQRLAVRLWDTVGRDLYDGINKMIDTLAIKGDWKKALEEVGVTWEKVTGKVKEAWKNSGMGDKVSEKFAEFKEVGIQNIKEWAFRVGDAVTSIWTTLITTGLQKVEGLAADLSRMHFGVQYDKATKTMTPYFYKDEYVEAPAAGTNLWTTTYEGKNKKTTVLNPYLQYLKPLVEKYDPKATATTVEGLRVAMMREGGTVDIPGVIQGMPITSENVDNLITLLANKNAGLPIESILYHTGLGDYYVGDRPIHNTINGVVEGINQARDEVSKSMKSWVGSSSAGTGAGVSSAPVSGEQVYRFELEIGGKTYGARVSSKGVELLGLQSLGTVQIGNGITLSVNKTAGGN